jgi:hypothetical protein
MSERYEDRADEFVKRVKATEIGLSTEVWLIYHCVDLYGNELAPIRTALEPSTKVDWPGNSGAAAQFAAYLHVGTICDNIDTIVRHLPECPVRLHEGPPHPVIVRDVEMEIVQPSV